MFYLKEGTKIVGRYFADLELKNAYIKCNNKYTFTELKKIKDENYNEFLNIIEAVE